MKQCIAPWHDDPRIVLFLGYYFPVAVVAAFNEHGISNLTVATFREFGHKGWRRRRT